MCLPCARGATLTQPRGLFTATPPSQLATTLHTTELVQPTWRMNENGHYARTAVQLAELSTHARRQEVIAALTAHSCNGGLIVDSSMDRLNPVDQSKGVAGAD